MFAGMVEIGRLLVRARKSKLRGGMERIDLQCMLECVDRLRRLFGLHIGCAEEIPGVGIVGIDSNYMFEGIDRGLRIPRIFGKQPEVIPRVGNLWILLERIFELGFRFFDFL